MNPQLLADIEAALRLLIEDNRKRGLGGADVNWAAIHYAAGVLKEVQRLEAEGGGTDENEVNEERAGTGA